MKTLVQTIDWPILISIQATCTYGRKPCNILHGLKLEPFKLADSLHKSLVQYSEFTAICLQF